MSLVTILTILAQYSISILPENVLKVAVWESLVKKVAGLQD